MDPKHPEHPEHALSEISVAVSEPPPATTTSQMNDAERVVEGELADVRARSEEPTDIESASGAGDGVSVWRKSSDRVPSADRAHEATLENAKGEGVSRGEARDGTVPHARAGQQAQAAEHEAHSLPPLPPDGSVGRPRSPVGDPEREEGAGPVLVSKDWDGQSLKKCVEEILGQGHGTVAAPPDDKKVNAGLLGHGFSTASGMSQAATEPMSAGRQDGRKTKAERLEWLRKAVKGIAKSEVGGQRGLEGLGRGGQANLWKGSYSVEGVLQAVAVKGYAAFHADDRERTEERALTEALLLHKISKAGCAHLIQCHGVVEVLQGELRELRLVLELAPQGSLDAILHASQHESERGVLNAPRFWRPADGDWGLQRREYVEERQLGWLLGIAKGLWFLHSNGLTHCDVKASNVLLFEDGRTPKLGDLGSCVLERNKQTPLHCTFSVATGRNEMMTRRYAAPERLGAPITGPRDGQVTAQPPVDVWSFGLLAFEVLFAEKVWKDVADTDLRGLEEAQKKGMTIEQMAPPELSVRDPRAALPGIDGEVEKCWARKPADRLAMADVVTFLTTLQSAAAESGETGPVVVSQEHVLCDAGDAAVRAVLPPGCSVVFPTASDSQPKHSIAALRVQRSTPTRAMLEAAAQPKNLLADGRQSSFLLVGHAFDYQPCGTHFTSPIKLCLPVWVDFLRQLEDEGVEFHLGVFTWDEQGGIWRENAGGCTLSGSESEAEAETSTFSIKVVGVVMGCFVLGTIAWQTTRVPSVFRTPVKFLAVAPVLDDVQAGRKIIFRVFVLEATKSKADDLASELEQKKLQVVGSSDNVMHVALPTNASIEVHPDRDDETRTTPTFTRVPYGGQCRLQYVPGEGAEKTFITGSVVASYESEVEPATPHTFFYEIECRPAPERQKRPEERDEQPIEAGQVEPRVVKLKPGERKDSRPRQTLHDVCLHARCAISYTDTGRDDTRIYAFFSSCRDDDLQLQQEAQKQTEALHTAVELEYEVSLFPVSTFDYFFEQMIKASSRSTEIVHFAGHGGEKGGLRWLSNGAADSSKEESLETIADVFGCQGKKCGGSVECVILNACDTEQLGRAVFERGVPNVLCWRGKVPDKAATIFAHWFYVSLTSQGGQQRANMNVYEMAYKAARIQVDRWREENGMSAPRGRSAVEPNALPAHQAWDLVFIPGPADGPCLASPKSDERQLESPDGVGEEDGSDGAKRSVTNRKGEAELQAFEALGVDLVFPTNITPPSRIRDNVRKYLGGMLRTEQLAKFGLEETQYEYSDSTRKNLKLKHLRLTVAALEALFQPEKLCCRPIHSYSDVFAEDGALLCFARKAKPGARRKARQKLGESLQLRDSDLRNPTHGQPPGFDGHHHMATVIKECWEHLGKLDADTVVHR